MTVKKKYTFKHEKDLIAEGLGVSNSVARQFLKKARRSVNAGSSTIEIMELSMNAAKPKNEIEAMLLGYFIGSFGG